MTTLTTPGMSWITNDFKPISKNKLIELKCVCLNLNRISLCSPPQNKYHFFFLNGLKSLPFTLNFATSFLNFRKSRGAGSWKLGSRIGFKGSTLGYSETLTTAPCLTYRSNIFSLSSSPEYYRVPRPWLPPPDKSRYGVNNCEFAFLFSNWVWDCRCWMLSLPLLNIWFLFPSPISGNIDAACY